MSTRSRLKNITKPVKPQDRCILGLKHQRNYTCVLAVYIRTPIDSKFNYCFPCEKEQPKRYARAIKSGSRLTFEHFRDIQFENSLICIRSMACEHCTEEMIVGIDKKLEDFQAEMAQKYYNNGTI